jgi:hypothetical protein
MAIRHLRNRVTREVFVRRLAAATDCDVPAPRYRLARLQVWHDVPHVFPLFEFLPQARAALADIARFIDHQLPPTGGPRGTEIQRTDRQGLCPADGPEVAGGAQPGRG